MGEQELVQIRNCWQNDYFMPPFRLYHFPFVHLGPSTPFTVYPNMNRFNLRCLLSSLQLQETDCPLTR